MARYEKPGRRDPRGRRRGREMEKGGKEGRNTASAASPAAATVTAAKLQHDDQREEHDHEGGHLV